MEIKDLSAVSNAVVQEVERAVVGKRGLLEMVMAAVLASGHILLEDYPGLGKTLVAQFCDRTGVGIQAHPIYPRPAAW
jgi:MoxR-like ATPase